MRRNGELLARMPRGYGVPPHAGTESRHAESRLPQKRRHNDVLQILQHVHVLFFDPHGNPPLRCWRQVDLIEIIGRGADASEAFRRLNPDT